MINKILLIVLFVNFSHVFAQPEETVRSILIIDCPTAGSLDRGSYLVGIQAYENGGILGNIMVGLTDRFMLGISYGGTNLIGSGPVDWNPMVGVLVRYRLFEEQLLFPAISLGFDNQGRGAYIDSLKRYMDKSKGLYAVASKSFRFLGTMALHGGMNYSFEGQKEDKDVNLFFGIEKSINNEIGIYMEYNLGLNDNEDGSIGYGKGYLNAGLKWAFQGRFFIDFLWKDILKNNTHNQNSSREIRISYVEYF